MSDDDLSAARLGLLAALREGDVALAYRLVLGLMGEGHPLPVILDAVLAPIQREAGRRWEVGDATIPEEHASTAAVETLVAMLAGGFDAEPDAEVVVVVCAEGDDHSLPARMAGALLTYEGYRTVFLGTSVPADDLAAYLEGQGADVLVVSCSRPANLLGARACVAAGHRAGLPVVVGGRAFDGGRWWERIGADAYAPTLPALVEVLHGWEPDPAAAEQRAATTPPAVADLRARRAAVAATLAARLGAPHDRLVTDTALELADALAVALTLGDPAVLAEQARWAARLLGHQTGVAVTPGRLLAALADAGDLSADDRALVAAAGAEP